MHIPTKLHNLSTLQRIELASVLVVILLAGVTVYALLNPTKLNNPNISASQQRVTIKITDKGFEPQFITVSVGTIVTWNNTDSFLHSVASNPFPESSEHPDLKTAKPINTGDNYTYRVNKPGTYNYHDPLYPERGGTVQVTNSTE